MRPDEIRAVTKRISRDLVNDKRILIVIFVTPIFTMLVYGIGAGNYISDVPVVVVNKDEGYVHASLNVSDNISNKIVTNLNKTVLKLQYADDVSDAIGRVKHGGGICDNYFSERTKPKRLHLVWNPIILGREYD